MKQLTYRTTVKRLLLIILTATISISGCRVHSGKATLKHDPGDLNSVRNMPDLWIELTREEVINRGLHQKVSDGAKAVAHNDQRNIKVQRILDALDQKAREIDPAINAPSPKAFVYDHTEVNAYVTTLMIEMPTTIRLKNSQANETRILEIEGFDRIYLSRSSSYKKRTSTRKQVIEALASLTPSIRACLEESDSTLVIDKSCLPERMREEFEDIVIKGISYDAHVNYIFVSTSIMEMMSDDELTAIIAHELGHYYKAQGYTSSQELDYFYDKKDPNNHGKRPTPLPKEHELARLGRNLLATIDNWIPATVKVSSQKFHSLIYDAFQKEWGRSYCYNCNSCLELKKINLDGFPFAPLKNRDLSKYEQYENLVVACSFELGDSFAPITRRWLRYSSLGPILTQLGDPTSFSSFEKMLIDFSNSIPEIVERNNEPISKLIIEANEKLGHYTFEQEADEIGLEISRAIGIPLEATMQALFKLSEMKYKRGILIQFPGHVDYVTCKNEYEEGFKNPITIGDFRDPHHSYCYRIYHIHREAKERGLSLR